MGGVGAPENSTQVDWELLIAILSLDGSMLKSNLFNPSPTSSATCPSCQKSPKITRETAKSRMCVCLKEF